MKCHERTARAMLILATLRINQRRPIYHDTHIARIVHGDALDNSQRVCIVAKTVQKQLTVSFYININDHVIYSLVSRTLLQAVSRRFLIHSLPEEIYTFSLLTSQQSCTSLKSARIKGRPQKNAYKPLMKQ